MPAFASTPWLLSAVHDARAGGWFGFAAAAGIDDAAIPHAFFAMSGAAGLIFAVASNCRRLTGLDPTKRAAIEAHADFVADLMIR